MSDNIINTQETQSLLALGYLFLRMGYYEQSKKVFSALLLLDSSDTTKKVVYKNLAAIAVNQKEYKEALDYLREALGDGKIKAKDGALYLLKAEALWQSSRKNEAQNALDQYYNIVNQF